MFVVHYILMTIMSSGVRKSFFAWQLPYGTGRLTRDEFRQAIKAGRGRAAHHLRQFGDDGVGDILQEAFLNNWAYDKQCEDNRATFLCMAVSELPSKQIYFDRVKASFLMESEYWNARQMAAVLAHCADNGDVKARELLYERLRANSFDGKWDGEHFPSTIICLLDGVKGLIEVAKVMGEDEFHQGETERHVRTVSEVANIPVEAVLSKLSEVAESNLKIARFLNAYSASVNAVPEETTYYQHLPLVELMSRIESGSDILRESKLSLWGKKASDDEIEAAFDWFLKETDEIRLQRLMRVFRVRKVPRLHEKMFALTKHANAKVRMWSFEMLANIQHQKVRDFALGYIHSAENGTLDSSVINLFEKNHAKGDGQAIFEALSKVTVEDESDVHSTCLDFKHELPEIDAPDLFASALTIYEAVPCSSCRNHTFEWMFKNKVAPAMLIEECKYDSDSDTVQLAQKGVSARNDKSGS